MVYWAIKGGAGGGGGKLLFKTVNKLSNIKVVVSG